MNADSNGNRRREQIATVVRKLLGSLELQVMEYMWQAGEATVGQVTKAVESRRRIAYTTAMTVMVHLVDKGLLVRSKEGKRYRYRVAKSREDFLRETSRSMVRALVNELGGPGHRWVFGGNQQD